MGKYESTHANNILTLVNEFGQDKEEEIRRLYLDQKTLLEKDARIIEFLPIFTYKLVRETLKAQYVEGYLEKKIHILEKKIKSNYQHK
jgi:hypothetical protein